MISGESMENLVSFDPKSGFHLTPKFVEQQSEPWGQFYCKNEETKEKSGIITIQPKKGKKHESFGFTYIITKVVDTNCCE